MNDRVDRDLPHGQTKIWSYFQNRAPESFDAARPRQEFLLQKIQSRSATASPTILNIGVGSGHFERSARKRGWVVHSLDPDRPSVERLAADGIRTHVGSIEAIPIEDSFFDFVVASEVLEHLTDAQRRLGLQEISRVLKPQGWFLGTVPFSEDLATGETVCPECGAVFHRWGHLQSFDLKSIHREMDPWFELLRLRRTAFVSFRDRGLAGKFKSLCRWALAKMGQQVAVPTIYWIARRLDRAK